MHYFNLSSCFPLIILLSVLYFEGFQQQTPTRPTGVLALRRSTALAPPCAARTPLRGNVGLEPLISGDSAATARGRLRPPPRPAPPRRALPGAPLPPGGQRRGTAGGGAEGASPPGTRGGGFKPEEGDSGWTQGRNCWP